VLGMMGSLLFSETEPGRWLRGVPPAMNIGPLRAWTGERDIPSLPARSFRQLWRARAAGRPR
jgi:hypothetical protein